MPRLSARDTARLTKTITRDERRPLGGGIPARPRRANTFVLGLIPMVAPAGGIAAGGSATCTYRVRSGSTLVAGSKTETVVNSFTNDVAASADLWCTWYDGVLWVVIEDCP